MVHSVIFVVCLLTFSSSNGREQIKFNANNDFLLHESSNNGAQPKRDYLAQFPPLGTPGSQTAGGQISPIIPPNNPSSPKRDYVAPNQPTIKEPITPPPSSTPSLSTPQKSQGGPPKRDYVAPNFPSPSTSSHSPGNSQQSKVKDLINFYDNKAQDTPTKAPSYSSIAQGSNKQTSPVTQGPFTASTSHTNKPLSFSATVAGQNKPNIPLNKNAPTLPSSTANNRNSQSPLKPISNNPTNDRSGSPTKPSLPPLPSTILQNQKNKNAQSSNSSGPTDFELQTLSEELLRKDSNNAAKYITINYQDKTSSHSKDDKAPLPLMTISDDAWNIPTIMKIIPLLDNYERDTLVNEYVTPQERNEENVFMDTIMSTSVIRHLMTFLKEKGYVTPDPKQQRDFLKQLWFSLYSRGKGKISSSGFEHIFVSELKKGDISGLHNWVYFAREETARRANYLGYLKYLEFGNKGAVLKLHFEQQGVTKPVNSMFIGTSPELEIALYTLCFVTRADKDCTLKLDNNNVNIVTHTFRYRSKNLIGSAYPQI